MKKVIRLTESDIHRIVKNSVKRILKEDDYDPFTYSNTDLSYPKGADFLYQADEVKLILNRPPEVKCEYFHSRPEAVFFCFQKDLTFFVQSQGSEGYSVVETVLSTHRIMISASTNARSACR